MTDATAVDDRQIFIIDLLKAISQNQDIYPLLRQNLDKLNNNFALELRSFAVDYFTKQPAKAVYIAKIIEKFSKQIQEFDQGNPISNLEIAIAGYETSLQILTRETYPQEWGNIQQALVSAYNQRQRIINKTLAEIKQNTADTQTDASKLVGELRSELQQVKQQFDNFTNQQLFEQVKQTTQEVNLIKTTLSELENIHRNQASIDIQAIVTAIQQVKSSQERFNTVILYDVENLTLGNKNPVFKFSLKNIIEQVQQISVVEKIAIQCAYADWTNHKFGAIRRDIQELGIEPVQIFGFSYGKNAADIQLAIDAVELTYSKNSLEVFVIVSGDGAFASLAKKLHEQGKTVIGCAYENHTNKVFAAVCDYFIWLPEPEINRDNPTNPIRTIATIEAKINYNDKDVLQHLKNTEPYSSQLKSKGISLSHVYKAFKELIPGFNYKSKGFSRFKTFLNSICQNSEFEIFQHSDTECVLKIRQINPRAIEGSLVLA